MPVRKISELAAFDAVDYLRDEQDYRLYLSEILKDGNTALCLSALGDVAKAQGMCATAPALTPPTAAPARRR